MDLFGAFEYGFDRIQKSIRNCEEKRLDPPSERPLINCMYCEGRGYFKAAHCAGPECNFLRYCPCKCQNCAYVECDICSGYGEFPEPEDWQEDAYWEARWDSWKEQRESGGAA